MLFAETHGSAKTRFAETSMVGPARDRYRFWKLNFLRRTTNI
jgi:hypothetical protein